MNGLNALLARADHCHGLVVRDGEQDVCGKPPVAVIDARDLEDGCYWPACAYHAHRYGRGRGVPLAELLTVAWDRGASEGLRTPTHLDYWLRNPYAAAVRAEPSEATT